MDDFKQMAEAKMRETIESKVQSEIDADEERLTQQQEEFDNLQSQDSRAEKRQSWLQAISGQTAQPQPQMEADPTSMGAKPGLLGSSAGRPMRGALAQAAAQHTPSMGLAGMRAPRSAAKSLGGSTPLVKPVKAPVGGSVVPEVGLPKPIAPKMVRQPIQPVGAPPQVEDSAPVAESTIAPSAIRRPQITPPESVPKQTEIKPEVESLETPSIVKTPKLDIAGITPVTEIQPEAKEIETIDDLIEEDLDEIEEISEVEIETEVEEVQIKPVVTTLTPIKKLLVAEVEEVKEVVQVQPVVELPVLKPVAVKKLQPVKRGGPPTSAPGKKPVTKLQPKVTTLTPITKLKPVTESQNEEEN